MNPKSDDCAGNDKYTNADDVYDPMYKMFLENVKKDGKSYVLTVGGQNGLPRLWKYEEKDDSLDGWGLDKCDTQVGSGVKRKKSRKKSRTLTKRKKEFVTEEEVVEEESIADLRNMIEEDYEYVLDNDIISSYDMVEEDYMSILVGHQKTEKGNIKFYYEGRWVRYEDDSDSDVYVIDPKTFEKEEALNPFVPSKVFNATVEEDDNQCLGSSGGPSGSLQSQFRKKLLTVLQRPYDPIEYKRLRDDISVRRPIEINRELRNGRDRMYTSNKNGKSYLDHYSDFRRKFKAAKDDQHKQLNLLRGFFFYFENLTQVGAFKPWKDQSCLAMMPASP